MPTIVDELVTVLKLDSSDMERKTRQAESQIDSLKRASAAAGQQIKDGTKDATNVFASLWNDRIERVEENLKKLTNESRRTAVNMKSSGKEAAEFFTNIKSEALGLIGVLVGATGLTSMLRNSAEAARNLKQEATEINIDPQRLSAMSLALERHGGSAEGTRGSLMGISQALENRKLYGDPSIVRFLAQIGATADQKPDAILDKFIEYAQKNKADGPLVTSIGRGLGIDQGTINAALSLKSMAEYQKDYNDALKDSPTKQELDNLDKLVGKFKEFEQAVGKFGTDYSADHANFFGWVLDGSKDFLRDNKALIEGLTDLTAAMAALKAASLTSGALGFDGLATVLKTIGGLLGGIARYAPWLLATGPAGGEDPAFSEQKNQEFLRNRAAGSGPGAPLAPDVEAEVRRQAGAFRVDPDHMVRLARVEHGGYDNVSPAGAIGPMQLMPGTAKDLGVNPHDWHQNIEGGVRYYRQLLAAFNGNYAAADAAYNAGPNNPGVKRFFQTGDPSGLPPETQAYVNSINGTPNGVPKKGPTFGPQQPVHSSPGYQGSPGAMNPLIFPGAYHGGSTSDNSKTVHITAPTTINVKNGDANNIARDWAQALTVQANRGLV
jgi:Transglycosylase SLT domain